MGGVAQALTDKDFLTATPEDQKAYLSSVDHDFAKASPADQDAYHTHVVAPAVRANSAKMNAQPTAFEKAQSENPIDTNVQNPILRGLSSAGGTVMSAFSHPIDTAKGALESLGDAATLGLTKGSPLSQSVDTWLNPKTRPTWEGIKSVLPEALGQGIGTVALGEGIGAAAPPAAKLAARGARAIGGIPGAISDIAKEAPDVAAQRALKPPAKQAIRFQKNLETARPFLQGATNLEDLQQGKIPAAKAEVWKPYNDAVQLVGQNVVQGPDGPISVADLEKMRLETSAQLDSTRRLNPTDRQSLDQKNGAIKELSDRYKQITGALDPQLASTGIDPQLIRNVHGSIKGIERLAEGRNTVTESKPYGLGRIGNKIDIVHPIRSLGQVGGGIRDIVAGRPLFRGNPTDVAVGEGFRTGGPKPNFGTPQAPAVGAAPATPPAPFIVPRPVQLNLGRQAAGIGAIGAGDLAATGTAGPEVANVAPQPPAAIPVAPPAPIAAAPAVRPMTPPAVVPRGTPAVWNNFGPTNAPGMIKQGNLDLSNRPIIRNADGTHSSEYSTSFADEKGREVLVPTIVDGKFLTPDGNKPIEGSPEEKAMFKRAWQHYLTTGQNLGTFDSPEHADAAANLIHSRAQR